MQPNQFVYHKVGGSLSFNELELQPVVQQTPAQKQQQAARAALGAPPEKEERLREFLYDMSSGPQTEIDEREAKYFSLFAPVTPSVGQPAGKLPPLPVQQPAAQPLLQQTPGIVGAPPVQQPAPQPPMFQYPVQPSAIGTTSSTTNDQSSTRTATRNDSNSATTKCTGTTIIYRGTTT
jgi:hypothetical protein